MGLLDSIVGGMLGGGQAQQGGSNPMLQIILGMLANSGGNQGAGGGLGGLGGLAGMVEKFQQSGLGDVASSWVSAGANRPVSGEQLQSVFGNDMIAQIAQQLGMSHGDTLGQLSQMLPEVVDKLTPGGQMPSTDQSQAGNLGDLIGSMLQR